VQTSSILSLYYRLNVFTVELPALRDRLDDLRR
jgi:transcriptional regulator with PAS, ATPase and Fis domain